jgi:Pvc16 N-terminal domain
VIGTALNFVRRELNASFRQLQGDARDVVVLGGLAGAQGAGQDETNNRILLSLFHLRQDTTFRNQQVPARGNAARTPPISIVLHTVFVSNYTDYQTGLDLLADVIGILQAKPVFDHASSPDLDPRIERLIFAMLNLEYSELSYAWGLLRTDFRPSAFYEVRMLPLTDPRRTSSTVSTNTGVTS